MGRRVVQGVPRGQAWPRWGGGRRRGWHCTGSDGLRGRFRRQIRTEVVDELDHVLEGREVAELEALLALDAVGLADRGEGLGLLHGVDAEVGLEVEVHLEHVRGVAGLVGHDLEDLLDDGVLAGWCEGRRGGRGRAGAAGGGAGGGIAPEAGGCGWRFGRQIRAEVVDELDHVLEGREVAELEALLALDAVGLAHRGEGLGLLHGVDTEVGLEVEVHLEHVRRVAGLLGDDLEDLLDHDGVTEDDAGGGARGPRGRPRDERGRHRGRHASRSGGAVTERSGAVGDRRVLGRQVRTVVVDELHHVLQRREVAELQVLLALDPVLLPNRGEGLGLLHGVHPEVRLEVQLEVEHVGGIAGLLGHDGQAALHDGIGGRRESGRCLGGGNGGGSRRRCRGCRGVGRRRGHG